MRRPERAFERRPDAWVEADEVDAVDVCRIGQRLSHRSNSDRGRLFRRVAVDAATDRREGHRAQAVLLHQLDRAAIASGELLRLAP